MSGYLWDLSLLELGVKVHVDFWVSGFLGHLHDPP